MTLHDYLSEDGSGPMAAHRVPDLAGTDPISLLIVLESPHTDEVVAKIPVVGQTGRHALEFLRDAPSGQETLGEVVAALHVKGDARVAIVNVSEMPLQREALDSHLAARLLPDMAWQTLAKARHHSRTPVSRLRVPEVSEASRLLVAGLQRRIDCLDLDHANVFVAGNFAQRHWRELSNVPTNKSVTHPSRQHWNSPGGGTNLDLLELRRLFMMHTS